MTLISGNAYLRPEIDALFKPTKVGQANLYDATRSYAIGDVVRLNNGGEVISLTANPAIDPNTAFVGGG